MKEMKKNQEIVELFLKDNHNRFSSETTRGYKISLGQFFTFCTKEYDEVKPGDIRSWLVSMEESGLKPTSRHAKLSGLKSFYQYCIEENKLERDPTKVIRTPQKDDRLPYYLSNKQLILLQELTKTSLRERAIIEALYATGVRISELLNIKKEDIKWDSRQIWIRKGKGNRERFVLFTHACEERIRLYLKSRKDDTEYIFSNGYGGPLSRVTVQLKFREFSKELGFKVTPHTMRHTFAAHLSNKGMSSSNIQELMGHVNINSTRIYTRLMNNAQKKKYDQYQP